MDDMVICPGCGQPITVKRKADTGTEGETRAQPSGAQSSNDPTLAPPSQGVGPRSLTHAFLAPPRAPDELGWLGTYRVFRVLGAGGMGTVFLAEDSCLNRKTALKTMRPEIAVDPSAKQRFLREAQATANIRSDHIVTIFQVGEESGVPFLAMELLEGSPLDRWLEDQSNKRATVKETLDIGRQVAKGLDAAHSSGLVHRDIKPANIWVERSTGRVKILDFGLVRVSAEDQRITQTGMVMGTPAYMAPEQAEGERVDFRTDLFSLGCVLYELCTGNLPFERSSTLAVLKAVALFEPPPPHQVNPEVPEDLSELIIQLMAKKKEERPGSAAEVVERLEGIMGLNTQTRQCLTSGASLRRTERAAHKRRPLVYLAAGFAIALGLAVAVFSFMRYRTPAPAAGSGPDLVFGLSAPFSGTNKELGNDMELGIQTYFKYINDQGGVNGRKLKLIPLDDGYEPDRALENMKDLVEQHKVMGVIGNVGTPTAEVTVPYALEQNILFVGAFTGADLLRHEPPDRYVINFRASYEEETAAVVDYLLAKGIQPSEIAVFQQNDGFGNAGFRGVARALKNKVKENQILRLRYERNATQVKEAVTEVLKHPEIKAVVMVATYKPAARFIAMVRPERPEMMFTNVSFVGSEALAFELEQQDARYGDGVIVTQVVPDYNSRSTAITQFRERLHKYYPQKRPNFVVLEGYLAAALLVEGLKRAGQEISPGKVIDAFESINGLDLGIGTTFNLGPSEHQASHKVWGTILKLKGKDMDKLQYEALDLD
ncbi:MAG: ABC transporter substrate-binding protein [Gemmataceae bacterium]